MFWPLTLLLSLRLALRRSLRRSLRVNPLTLQVNHRAYRPPNHLPNPPPNLLYSLSLLPLDSRPPSHQWHPLGNPLPSLRQLLLTRPKLGVKSLLTREEIAKEVFVRIIARTTEPVRRTIIANASPVLMVNLNGRALIALSELAPRILLGLEMS